MKLTANTRSKLPSRMIGAAGSRSITPPSTYRWPLTSTDSINTGSAIAIRTSRPMGSSGVTLEPK